MLLETRVPFGYIFRKVRRNAFFVLCITTVVELGLRYGRDVVPEVSIAIPSFLGTAISLLLSFKLSQSYDRWWEARKIWGAIVNDSRTLLRQVLAFDGSVTPLGKRIAHRQIAWCYALGQSLRGQDWWIGTEGHLDEDDVAEAQKHVNKPLVLLQQHARDVTLLAELQRITDFQRIALDETLTRLTDSMGKAERIRSTVFPKTYRVFLHAFIYLFITILSVSLGEINAGWQVMITTLISIPFFLLERTATHMQDPFSNRPTDTPVTAVARTIEINLLQLIGQEDVPPPLAPDGFYVM